MQIIKSKAFEEIIPGLVCRDRERFATSREVAEIFGKRHDNVIRAIKNLVSCDPELSLKFEAFKIKDLTGESTSHYEMDRDGFTLLVMGFSGANALKFKLAYIAEFNRMEEALRSSPPAPARPMTSKEIMERARDLAAELLQSYKAGFAAAESVDSFR